MNFDTSEDFATGLDRQDPLDSMRDRFHIPPHEGGETVYLCGHSLGLQPRDTQRLIEEELEDWRRFAVEGHFQARRPWMPYPRCSRWVRRVSTNSSRRRVNLPKRLPNMRTQEPSG